MFRMDSSQTLKDIKVQVLADENKFILFYTLHSYGFREVFKHHSILISTFFVNISLFLTTEFN